jgi:hypothetical protein
MTVFLQKLVANACHFAAAGGLFDWTGMECSVFGFRHNFHWSGIEINGL